MSDTLGDVLGKLYNAEQKFHELNGRIMLFHDSIQSLYLAVNRINQGTSKSLTQVEGTLIKIMNESRELSQNLSTLKTATHSIQQKLTS